MGSRSTFLRRFAGDQDTAGVVKEARPSRRSQMSGRCRQLYDRLANPPVVVRASRIPLRGVLADAMLTRKPSVVNLQCDRTKTDTGRQGEYPKALESPLIKELGKMTP
jgi:hypothetical protein